MQVVDLEAKIYERYPKQREELNCAVLRRRLMELRELYRQRLINEKKEKNKTTGDVGCTGHAASATASNTNRNA